MLLKIREGNAPSAERNRVERSGCEGRERERERESKRERVKERERERERDREIVYLEVEEPITCRNMDIGSREEPGKQDGYTYTQLVKGLKSRERSD
jgi:hypothetical protein